MTQLWSQLRHQPSYYHSKTRFTKSDRLRFTDSFELPQFARPLDRISGNYTCYLFPNLGGYTKHAAFEPVAVPSVDPA